MSLERLRAMFWLGVCLFYSGLVVSAAPAPIRAAGPNAIFPCPDNEGALRRLVIQVAGDESDRVLPLVNTLLPQLQATTAVEIICREAGDQRQVMEAITALRLEQAERVRVHQCPSVETIWARDRFVAGVDPRGDVCLLSPPEASTALVGDFAVPGFLSARFPNWRHRRAVLRLEGGDLLVGRNFALVGGTTVRRAGELYGPLSADEFQLLLSEDLTKRALVVPQFEKVEPVEGHLDYHLDMFLTVLHDDSVLLADIEWGEQLAAQFKAEGGVLEGPPEEDQVEASVPFEDIRRRLEVARQTLVRAGLRVRRVPLYVIPDRGYFVTYNNMLQEETPRGRVAYLPYYNAGPLDREAGRVYGRLGYTVKWVDVRPIYSLQGALRCVVNVVERGPQKPGL